MNTQCTCIPCPGLSDDGAYGHWNHCAECCSGTYVEVPDEGCPKPEHRELAAKYYGGRKRVGVAVARGRAPDFLTEGGFDSRQPPPQPTKGDTP